MSSVLQRSELEKSPLADLHTIANEIGIDGFRRLRKPDLIDAILGESNSGDNGDAKPAKTRTSTSSTRTRTRTRSSAQTGAKRAGSDEDRDAKSSDRERKSTDSDKDRDDADELGAGRSRRGRRGGRGRTRASEGEGRTSESRAPESRTSEGRTSPGRSPEGRKAADISSTRATSSSDTKTAEGTVEVLANGSGFLRQGKEPGDGDVYISSAQIRRCELVTGDKVSGPTRSPRRSERYPALVRVETINGKPAAERAETGTKRFEDLPLVFPFELFRIGAGGDPALRAIETLTPFGKGSRVMIAGASQSGKSEAFRQIAHALAVQKDLSVSVLLLGVRPEEQSEWTQGGTPTEAALTFDATPDAQAQALERAIDKAKRAAARGGDAVVLVDTLQYVAPQAARKAMAAARKIKDGGSLTIIATAPQPIGGETTVIGLNPSLTAQRRQPAIDFNVSATQRPELLVGQDGAAAISRARSDALSAQEKGSGARGLIPSLFRGR